MQAILEALHEWRHLLEGTEEPFIIRTDNQALKWFMTSRLLSRHQARWASFLADFKFLIEHVPGLRNKADGLSRQPDYFPQTVNNDNTVLLPPCLFINTIIIHLFM